MLNQIKKVIIPALMTTFVVGTLVSTGSASAATITKSSAVKNNPQISNPSVKLPPVPPVIVSGPKLSSLYIPEVVLSPKFQPNITQYFAYLKDNKTQLLTIYTSAAEKGSVVKINGQVVTNGFLRIPIKTDVTQVKIEVTYGKKTNVYLVNVVKGYNVF
jgi:hypothetical protein